MKNILKSACAIVLAGFCVFMNSSCTNRNLHPRKTKTLDSLALALDKTDSTLSKSDTVQIRKCIEHIFITIGQVQSDVTDKKDTVSKGAAEILRSFNGIRWQLQTFLGREPVLRTEMKKSAEQLRDLSHDISINRIPADSVNIFFELETKKANELLETAQQGFNSLNIELPLYELVLPKADSLINRISKHEGI